MLCSWKRGSAPGSLVKSGDGQVVPAPQGLGGFPGIRWGRDRGAADLPRGTGRPPAESGRPRSCIGLTVGASEPAARGASRDRESPGLPP